MPRIAAENLQRVDAGRLNLVSGDGRRPICQKCVKSRRECDRRPPSLKFVVHSTSLGFAPPQNAPSLPETVQQQPWDSLGAVFDYQDSTIEDPREAAALGGMIRGRRSIQPSQNYRKGPETLELAHNMAACSARVALHYPGIARLFAHYVDSLAPWYDLNEASQVFGTIVPMHALDSPVLFKALIAFAATHKHKTSGESEYVATSFHAACVSELLLSIEHIEPEIQGDYLAATCLLRSYEILNANSRKEQRHLLGAYSFVAGDSLDLADRGLLQAGAWNYLREEITVALECRRTVRISPDFEYHPHEGMPDDMRANYISYLLARIINISFRESTGNSLWEDKLPEWQSLETDFKVWKHSLPPSFSPYSTAHTAGNVFPSLWMLRPWHVAAQQYCSVAELLLMLFKPLPLDGDADSGAFPPRDELAEGHALKICGLAYTNDSVAARVNAFGPLAFCGRYLKSDGYRDGLEAMLLEFGKSIGWPVGCILEDLQQHWSSSVKHE